MRRFLWPQPDSELMRHEDSPQLTPAIESLLSKINPPLGRILDKALEGVRLSIEDGYQLFMATGLELNALVLVANELRRRTVGDIVTFVVNRNINFTNICLNGCRFCAFSRKPTDPDAYLLSIKEVVRRAKEAWEMGATEVCIQGGLHPDIREDFYQDVCRSIKKETPCIHIHAFSPMEIIYGAEKRGLALGDYLVMLKEAGLDSIPGTAAEILNDQVRRVICPSKIDVETWVKVVVSAHTLGIPTTATIMYGHVDTPMNQVQHLALLREIQEKTSGFTELVPLGFIHHNSPLYRMGLARPGPTGLEDLRMHSISRLMLNSCINNIQVSWVKLGPKLAQVCLDAGANDFGGTLMDESISKAAGATTGQSMSAQEFKRIIRDVGRIPAQRTTTYEIVEVFE